MQGNLDGAATMLDEQSLRVFAQKGRDGGARVVQAGNANAVKVRRVMQVASDLASRPLNELRVLDVACGEGVYSIEAGVHGAQVLGCDARMQRMSHGLRCAEVNGLSSVRFQIDDARKISRQTHGHFDIVLFLGILYHLDVPDVFHVLEALHDVCVEFVIIDTHIALKSDQQVEHNGQSYRGRKSREHNDADSPEARNARVMASVDNTFAFHFTRESLVQLLNDVGFTSVFECLAPLEPGKPADRVTLVAHKGRRVHLSTYPWVNGLTEREIVERLEAEKDLNRPSEAGAPNRNEHAVGGVVKRGLKRMLRKCGYELRRVQ